MSKVNSFGKIVDDILEGVGKSIKGEPANVILKSNKAINPIVNGVINNSLGGVEMIGRMTGTLGHASKEGLKDAFAHTFKEGGNLNYGKIAGSYIGLSAAARVATGGGLYKDRAGNNNIIGVPFI